MPRHVFGILTELVLSAISECYRLLVLFFDWIIRIRRKLFGFFYKDLTQTPLVLLTKRFSAANVLYES